MRFHVTFLYGENSTRDTFKDNAVDTLTGPLHMHSSLKFPERVRHIADALQYVDVFYCSDSYLRNRKHVPCFYRVIETREEVWEN